MKPRCGRTLPLRYAGKPKPVSMFFLLRAARDQCGVNGVIAGGVARSRQTLLRLPGEEGN